MAVMDRPMAPVLPSVPKERRRNGGLSLGEACLLAFQGLVTNQLRSFLTMLGVIIGVGAVIVMVALGEGAAQATRVEMAKLGTNRLYVRPDSQQSRGVSQGQGTAVNLKLKDADRLLKLSTAIGAVAPEYRGNGVTVKSKNKNTRTDLTGTTPDYFQIRNLPIEEGRIFTQEEVDRRARVAVLGSEVKETLFADAPAVGKTIHVNGQRFLVVGVGKKVGGAPWGNRDDHVTVPITTAMKRMFGAEALNGMSVQAASEKQLAAAEDEVYTIMKRIHKLGPDDPADVRVHNQGDVVETAKQQSSFLTMLLAGVALVSLVVGGIGIMNIMLVSVTERTREIGIRKAIGAKRKDILYQFLIESVTLSVVGGVVGIILGVGVALWMGMPVDDGGMGFPMVLTPLPMIAAFGTSAVVGIFFGSYPAMQASALDPIQALRTE
jgi:putative ABC transport system permease protein